MVRGNNCLFLPQLRAKIRMEMGEMGSRARSFAVNARHLLAVSSCSLASD